MSDKSLEDRVREAILWAEHHDEHVKLTTKDAKRLLYRLKKENNGSCPTCRGMSGKHSSLCGEL